MAWLEDNCDWDLYEQEIAEGIREIEIDDRIPEDLHDIPYDNGFSSEEDKDSFLESLKSNDLEMLDLF
ncbi:MAG: hypothetical protein WCI92_00595 [Bacteroidota bacterium]